MMGKKNKFNCFFILFFTGCVLRRGDVTSEVDLTSNIIVSGYTVYDCAKLRLKQNNRWKFAFVPLLCPDLKISFINNHKNNNYKIPMLLTGCVFRS